MAKLDDIRRIIDEQISEVLAKGGVWPPRTVGDINRNRLLTGMPPWSDIDVTLHYRRRQA